MLRGNARIGGSPGKGTHMPMLVVIVVLLVVVAVFSVQNAAPVSVSFLFWRFDASLAIVMILSVLAGMITGALLVSLRRVVRAAAKKREEANKTPPA